MSIALTLLAGLAGVTVVWLLSIKQRQAGGIAAATELEEVCELPEEFSESDDIEEIVDSGSFESFVSGVPRYEYEANVLYCEIKRLKISGNKQEIQQRINEILTRYPRSKAAHLIRKKLS